MNKAIVKSFELGYISSTTIMTNMPGFEEACQLTHENKLIDRIGIHLNLAEGKPLTQKITRFSIFCNDSGNFCFRLPYNQLLNKEEKKAAFQEMEAQINKCLKMGIKPTHIDSHQHCHYPWAIGQLVIEAARNFKIQAVRLCFNWGNRVSPEIKKHAQFFNKQLGILAKTKFFCKIQDVTPELLTLNEPVEVMVHPCRINNRDKVLDLDKGERVDDLINKFLPGESLYSYAYVIEQFSKAKK